MNAKNPTNPNLPRICILENPVLPYPWGSTTAIPELLGTESDPTKPQAEMWMGAHPKAPSTVLADGGRVPLGEWIASQPEAVLGQDTAERFGGRLPFLFKVLAAAEPLSVQAHPDRDQAREGFAREEALGIPIDAPHRNYRDPNHKPECICALTPFWGLCGFREPQAVVSLLDEVFPGNSPLSAEREALGRQPPETGIRRLFSSLLSLDPEDKRALLDRVETYCRQGAGDEAVRRWVQRLLEAYADDVGVLSPCLLHLVRLGPGEALYLPAGAPHAYLEGVGVELMANSDNVLRGGLTGKHVDVPELMRVLRFSPQQPEVMTGRPDGAVERFYDTPAEEFRLSAIEVDDHNAYRAPTRRSVEILLCTRGSAELTELPDGRKCPVAKGTSLIVPAACPGYEIRGNVRIYKATVPL